VWDFSSYSKYPFLSALVALLQSVDTKRKGNIPMLLGHELTITFAYAVSLSRKLKSSDDNTIIIPLYYHNNTIIIP
jgi:hypothetical protein